MIRRLILLALIIVLVMPVMAQDEDEAACSVGQLQDVLRSGVEVWIPLIDGLESVQDAFDLMIGFQAAIETQRTICSGGLWTSEEYANGIVGPIKFSGTLYQATLSMDTFGSVRIVTVDGNCGLNRTMGVNGSDGGEETDLLEFGGDCLAMFEVNTSEAWTMVIERLR